MATVAVGGGLTLLPSPDADLFQRVSFSTLSDVGLGVRGAGYRLLDRIHRRCPSRRRAT